MKRETLPFRINCEGYFFNEEGKVLAKRSEQGFIMFPGGGVDDNECINDTMVREIKEETGATITELKKLEVAHIIWSEEWAKTKKQKKRFLKFKGDEMHFFTGKVISIKEPIVMEEDYWQGENFMDTQIIINSIEREINNAPNDIENIHQRMIQLKLLRMLVNNEK